MGGAHDLFERDLFDLAPQASQPFTAPPAPAAVQPSVSATVHVRRGKFQAFVRLAEREVRPVEEVLGEWIGECANLIRQRDFAEAYGDDLFDETPTATTPAMESAARASDAREMYRTDADDHADFLARNGGEDCVGITLSIKD